MLPVMDYKYLLVTSYVVGIDTCFIIHHIYSNIDCIQVTRHWYEMSDESSSQLHLYLYPHALLICGNWIHCPWMESTLLELEMIVIMLLLPVFCCVYWYHHSYLCDISFLLVDLSDVVLGWLVGIVCCTLDCIFFLPFFLIWLGFLQ